MKYAKNMSYLEYPDRDYGFVERGGKGGDNGKLKMELRVKSSELRVMSDNQRK